VADQFLVK